MHIIMSILKIAGISLLVLSLLLIFLLILFVFVPFRYRITCDIPKKAQLDTAYANIKVMIYFPAFLFMASWEYTEQKMKGIVRIFGIIVVRKGKQKKKNLEGNVTKKQNKKRNKKQERKLKRKERKNKKKWQDDKQIVTESSLEDGKVLGGLEDQKKTIEKTDFDEFENQQKKMETMDIEAMDMETADQEKKSLLKKIVDFFKWIIKIGKQLKTNINHISSFGKNIKNTGNDFLNTWNHPYVKGGIAVIWQKLKILFLHLKPRSVCGRLHIGLSDPAATGWLLGIFSILYACYGDTIQIEPDFEQEAFDGELKVTGKIQAFVLIYIVWKLYHDKEVRYMVNKIRRVSTNDNN